VRRPSQIRSANILKALRDAGVPIVLGTDLTVPGFSIYRDMELAVRGGFTPMEAIQAATIVSARAMGKERESGTVEVGKSADLIIVDGPAERIEEIRKVERSSSEGGVPSAELWRWLLVAKRWSGVAAATPSPRTTPAVAAPTPRR
jgi:imidazolonepropionase-like amidohydrolase